MKASVKSSIKGVAVIVIGVLVALAVNKAFGIEKKVPEVMK